MNTTKKLIAATVVSVLLGSAFAANAAESDFSNVIDVPGIGLMNLYQPAGMVAAGNARDTNKPQATNKQAASNVDVIDVPGIGLMSTYHPAGTVAAGNFRHVVDGETVNTSSSVGATQYFVAW